MVIGRWDRLRIDQIVTNLLSNAIKYGQGKPIEVSVKSLGTTARLIVHDSGIGIDPEWQARLFQRFERAVSVRNYGGFGLGLWIVRQIVEAHGGTICLESRLGEGSTFVVDLPLAADISQRPEESFL
jgi:signal transduction histidine kinase